MLWFPSGELGRGKWGERALVQERLHGVGRRRAQTHWIRNHRTLATCVSCCLQAIATHVCCSAAFRVSLVACCLSDVSCCRVLRKLDYQSIQVGETEGNSCLQPVSSLQYIPGDAARLRPEHKASPARDDTQRTHCRGTAGRDEGLTTCCRGHMQTQFSKRSTSVHTA